ncbi:MAG: hypothetical protein HY782_07635 [Chloroflexi bacterium]|nr:hypothetical protein [Chloroflexota bacterium]
MFLSPHNIKRSLLVTIAALCLGTVLLLLQPIELQAQAGSQLRLLASDSNRVVLELEVASYNTRTRVANGTTYSVLAVPGLSTTSDPGKPQLPIKGAMIGIPQGARATIKILADDSRRDTLAYPPIPAPTAQPRLDPSQTLPPEPAVAIIPNAITYSANQFFPADAARIATIGNWRSQRYLNIQFNPLQYNPVARQLIFHKRLRVEITFSYPQGLRAETVGGALNEGQFDAILQQALLNYDTAKNWRARATAPLPRVAPRYAGGPWYKIAVGAEGMYKITCDALTSAGVSPLPDPRTLKVYKQGTELAIKVVGEQDGVCDGGDYALFYAQAINTKYTANNIYWLTYGGAFHKPMPSRDGSGSGSVAATFTDTLRIEQDLMYRSTRPTVDNADHWFWNWLPNGPNYADYPFQLDRLATDPFSATLTTRIVGFTTGGHHTVISVNGNPVTDTTWSGTGEWSVTASFPSTYLITTTTNLIRVAEPNDTVTGSYIYVNNFDLGYVSNFAAITDTLRFRQPAGAWRYEIPGFTTTDADAFDVTDPFNVVQFTNTSTAPVFAFSDSAAATHEYLALTPAQRMTPLSITLDTPSDLRNSGNTADEIIIAYGGFITAKIQDLVNYRSTQGLRVGVVDVQDIYDEFDDGLMDAQAIRDFLAYAYNNWNQPRSSQPPPSFVLLVGDGNVDFKNISGYAEPEPSYIPPFLRYVDPFGFGETVTDNRYVSFNDGSGDTLPNMAIGRLPALTASDVDAMVTKILNYEQNPPTLPKVTFVADNAFDSNGVEDDAGNFWDSSDQVALDPRYISPPITADRIYYNPCTDTVAHPQCAITATAYSTVSSVRTASVAAIDEGRLFVNFVGHGALQYWAGEKLFRYPDEVNSLNNDKLTVVLSWTCQDGYFVYPKYTGLAEGLLRLAGKGSVAHWTPSGWGYATGHDLLSTGFYDAVMQKGVRKLGPATVLGKVNLWTNGGGANRDLIDTFNLFGDPASRLALPTTSTVVLPPLSAQPLSAQIVLTWTTMSEMSISGYNLLRSNSAGGTYAQINPSLIPSKCFDCLTGASYSYADATVLPGQIYYYKLQSVDNDLNTQLSDPVSVRANGSTLYLPLIRK